MLNVRFFLVCDQDSVRCCTRAGRGRRHAYQRYTACIAVLVAVVVVVQMI